MRHWIDALVLRNPMRIEIARFRRRFLGFGGSGFNNVVLALALLVYTGLVMLVVNVRGDMPPVAIVVFQTGLLCFFGPAMLHGAIAGERERRTWDLLLVAPISKAQIVFGKFMGAAAAIGLGTLALGLPTVFAAVAYAKTTFVDLLLAEGVSVSFGLFVCALTLFLSARVKRPFMALGASLGTLLLAFLVVPALLLSLAGNERLTGETILYLNPFVTLFRLMEETSSTSDYGPFIPAALYGFPHILIYLGMALGLLIYAEKTLNFPENDVKFMPRGHQDA